MIKYTCGAGTPEEAETNCTYFIRGECTAYFCEYRRKKQTNADRIRSVSDEKLALFVRAIISAESCPGIDCDCDECFFKEPCSNGLKWYGKEIDWLQQPFEGE